LGMELDRIPLRRGNHVPILQLVDDFARYIYFPLLTDSSVLITAIRDGLTLLTWADESLAFAASYDESAIRYRGLRAGQSLSVLDANDAGLLVKPEVARQQLELETQTGGQVGTRATQSAEEAGVAAGAKAKKPHVPRRFHGAVELDPNRVGR